jgi:hypothetical protein
MQTPFHTMQNFSAIARLAIAPSLILLVSCNRNAPPQPMTRQPVVHQVYEAGGSKQQRIQEITALIEKHQTLPTAITDSYFLEEQIGDGEFGPSDYRDFYAVEVVPQAIDRWKQDLTPLQEVPDYVAPLQPQNWWIDREAFPSLQFYQPDPLTGRSTGWIGISPQTGKIYIFTFTT